jgi:hypothetical protein
MYKTRCYKFQAQAKSPCSKQVTLRYSWDMKNTTSPTQEAGTRWLYRGIGLVLGIMIVLAFKTLGAVAGAAFALVFMGTLVIFSKVF